jgi:malate synthase
MEDLATDRIYRLMIAQRMRHSKAIEIVDETGKAVAHTREVVSQMFDEELERLVSEGAKENDPAAIARLREARRMSEEMIERGEFDPA